MTAMALAGLVSSSRVTGLLAVWFAAFWGVFLSFYAGSYSYGADVRFSLMSYAPLVVLAGVGMSRLVRAAAVKIGFWSPRAIAIALLALQFTWYLPWVRSVGEEAWAARADVEFAGDVARQLPSNALVLTQNPGMFHVWGANAAQLSIAVDESAYVREVALPRYAGGVYIHWNFWCNVSDPIQKSFCNRALAGYSLNVFREQAVRNYRFAFYRIAPLPAR